MNMILKIILNRNFILVLSVIMGIAVGDYAKFTSKYLSYILILTMVFSMTGISTKALWPLKRLFKPMLTGTILNYFIFGIVILLLAWILMPSKALFAGFVVIVAAPPGVAVIPFTGILKGDVEYSVLGVFGAFVSSIVIAPLLIGIFSEGATINAWELFVMMVQLVLLPLVLSRILLVRLIFPIAEKIRGKAVDFGFALIIFTVVGINRSVFFSHPSVVLLCAVVLFVSSFGLGGLFEILSKRWKKFDIQTIPKILLLTVKSSGFSAVTALSIFGKEAAIPSAVLAVVVLIYLLFLSLRGEMFNRS